jgi:hypothetical protein
MFSRLNCISVIVLIKPRILERTVTRTKKAKINVGSVQKQMLVGPLVMKNHGKDFDIQ